MSFYLPAAIATAALKRIAGKPAWGAELKLLASPELANVIGTLAMTGATTCPFTDDPVSALPVGGADLQIQLTNEFAGTAQATVVVTGTDQTDVALVGTATLAKPGYTLADSWRFPVGTAWDVVPATGGKLFKTITSVACTGGVADVDFKVWQLPVITTFVRIPSITTKDFTTKSQAPKFIPEDLDGAADVKLGRSEPSKLNLTANARVFKDGLLRFDGQAFTIMAELRKENKVLVDRLIFTGWISKAAPTFPDGDEVATVSAEGFYEELLVFSAI